MSNNNSQTVEPGVQVQMTEGFDYSSLPESERLVPDSDPFKGMTYDQMMYAINRFNAQRDNCTIFKSNTSDTEDDPAFTLTQAYPDQHMGTYVYAAPFPDPPYCVPSFQTYPDPLTLHLQQEVKRLSDELEKQRERNDVLLGLLVDLVKASKR